MKARKIRAKMPAALAMGLAALLMAAVGPAPAAAQASAFAYVANFGSNDVSAYTIDAATGALTPIPGSPFAAGTGPTSVAVDPAGQFVYVANRGVTADSGSISVFAINATSGGLIPAAGSPFPAGSFPVSVAVDPTGQFLYAANCASFNCLGADFGTVSAFTIDSTTGALTPLAGSPFAAGREPRWVTVDPTGQFLYEANLGAGGNDVWAFTIDAATGSLTQVLGSPFAAGSRPSSVTVDPLGQFVYVVNHFGDNVSAYTVDPATGALMPVPGSPFPAGPQAGAVVVDPSGSFVYVTNQLSSNVSAYTVDRSTGALTAVAGSPFVAGPSPADIKVDTTGSFVYVANCGIGDCAGHLVPVASQRIASMPRLVP